MSSDRLLIRVDAAPHLGAGHALRCLALAQAWRAGGGKVTFATASMLPPLRDRLVAEGAELAELPPSADRRDDARRTARLATTRRAAWVVVDGYAFDDAYERTLHDSGLRVLSLDDYGHARHDFATAVLNQNPAAAEIGYPPYAARRQLLGRDYVLLRNEFRRPSRPRVEPARPPRRILVTLGGSDPENLTQTVVDALISGAPPEREPAVVVGPGYAAVDRLRSSLTSVPGCSLHVNVSDMAPLMDEVDLAVSAAGSTMWELAHRGVPTLSITTADNQRVVAAACRRAGLSLDLGPPDAELAGRLRAALSALSVEPDRMAAMSTAGRRLIDGRGADRVAHILRSYAA